MLLTDLKAAAPVMEKKKDKEAKEFETVAIKPKEVKLKEKPEVDTKPLKLKEKKPKGNNVIF